MGMRRTIKIGVLGVIILVMLGIVPVMAASVPIYGSQLIKAPPTGGTGCASPPSNWHPGMPIYLPMYCWAKLPTSLSSQVLNNLHYYMPLWMTPQALRSSPITTPFSFRMPIMPMNPRSLFTNTMYQLQSYSASLMNSLNTLGLVSMPPLVQNRVNLGNAIFIPASYVEKTYDLNKPLTVYYLAGTPTSTQYLGASQPVNPTGGGTPTSPLRTSPPQPSGVNIPTTPPSFNTKPVTSTPPTGSGPLAYSTSITLPNITSLFSLHSVKIGKAPYNGTGISPKPPIMCPMGAGFGGYCNGPPRISIGSIPKTLLGGIGTYIGKFARVPGIVSTTPVSPPTTGTGTGVLSSAKTNIVSTPPRTSDAGTSVFSIPRGVITPVVNTLRSSATAIASVVKTTPIVRVSPSPMPPVKVVSNLGGTVAHIQRPLLSTITSVFKPVASVFSGVVSTLVRVGSGIVNGFRAVFGLVHRP